MASFISLLLLLRLTRQVQCVAGLAAVEGPESDGHIHDLVDGEAGEDNDIAAEDFDCIVAVETNSPSFESLLIFSNVRGGKEFG